MSESSRDSGEFGVAAVGVPAGVAGVRAQVLRATPTVGTSAAGVPQPGDTDPIADLEAAGSDHDLADHFVSWRHTRSVDREVPFGDV